MDDATKQQLLQRAADLLGRHELAQRLNVPSDVLETWMRGDVAVPAGKLTVLACVLESFSREQRKT